MGRYPEGGTFCSEVWLAWAANFGVLVIVQDKVEAAAGLNFVVDHLNLS